VEAEKRRKGGRERGKKCSLGKEICHASTIRGGKKRLRASKGQTIIFSIEGTLEAQGGREVEGEIKQEEPQVKDRRWAAVYLSVKGTRAVTCRERAGGIRKYCAVKPEWIQIRYREARGRKEPRRRLVKPKNS